MRRGDQRGGLGGDPPVALGGAGPDQGDRAADGGRAEHGTGGVGVGPGAEVLPTVAGVVGGRGGAGDPQAATGRGADRLGALHHDLEGSGAGAAAGVRRDRSFRPAGARAGGGDAVRPVVPRAADPGRAGSGGDAAGAGDDVDVLAVLRGGDAALAAGRGPAGRDVAADRPDRGGLEDAGVGSGVGDRRARSGERRGGRVRWDAGHEDPAAAGSGSGIEGHHGAEQLLLRDLVPAGPDVHRPGGLQHPAGGLAAAAERPAGPLHRAAADRRVAGRSGRDDGAAAGCAGGRTVQPGAAGPGLLRAPGHQRLLRRPARDRPVRRRARVPDPGGRHLRGPGGGRPRPLLGPPGGGHRPRPRGRRGHVAGRVQPGQGRPRARRPPRRPARRAPARRRDRRRTARPARVRRPVRRRLRPRPRRRRGPAGRPAGRRTVPRAVRVRAGVRACGRCRARAGDQCGAVAAPAGPAALGGDPVTRPTTRAAGGDDTARRPQAATASSTGAASVASDVPEGPDTRDDDPRRQYRPARDLAAQMAYLTRVIKAPTIAAVWADLADQAREEGWSHEEYLAAVLARQVAAREANGTAIRTAGAHFPDVKTLDDFNLDHQPSLRRDVLAHLATCTFIPTAGNAILLGPPGVGKTHLAIGLGIKAVHAGHPVLFDTATGWVTRLRTAHDDGRLPHELRRLRRYRLLIIDEIGYIPFDADAANLFFQLISSRYEQGSVLATSNMPFSRWGEIFGDDVVAAAMIDRLVHHAEVLTLTGDSYRTRNRRELIAKDPATPNRNT